jgi:TraY domain
MAKKADIKRYPLNMRTTKQVRDRLAKAADKSGRSLAQEVEFRLERSLYVERHLMLARGDGWAPVVAVPGHLLVLTGEDNESGVVALKISPEGLERLRWFFRGAPHSLEHYSNKDFEGAGDKWLPLDLKGSK